MSAETRSLTAIVSSVIESKRDDVRINPTAIASAALPKLDGAALVAGCTLALRQIARSQLRKRFLDEPDDNEDAVEPERSEHDDEAVEPEQPDLFGGLQRRYPSSNGNYVLREQMSSADVSFNIRRLRAESGTKSKHADLLEAWWEVRKASETVAPAA